MTARKPRKGKGKGKGKGKNKDKKVAGLFSLSPILLALGAVALVFVVAFGGSALYDWAVQDTDPPVRTAQVKPPAPPPPATVPSPPTLRDVPAPVLPPAVVAPLPVPETPSAAPVPAAPQVAAMLPPPRPGPVAPVTPPGGVPLWRKNAAPGTMPQDRPAIAIVIDDMGLDRKRSNRVVKLPAPLTLAWLPYSHDLPTQARAAHAVGHELMLHMPMQPMGKEDPGPGALLVGLDRAEILRRFVAALDSFDGYAGVNNHMGSRFTADREGMAPVLAEIHRRGLLWLDSRTTAKSAGIALAQELKVPFAGRDVFLDNEATVAAVKAQLAKTEQLARRQGYAIAIGHPHDGTIQALAEWLPEARKRGFALVPVSAIVRARLTGG
jgi:polysaccharide deacetylase 2 family uncharacterized protein YibQ